MHGWTGRPYRRCLGASPNVPPVLPPQPYVARRSSPGSRRPSAPLQADRLRELAADLAACGSVQTAAICRAMADEVEGG